MLKIRLSRVGKKNKAYFRIIISENARDPQGKYIELLGNVNPHTSPSTINLKADRIKYWLSQGAQTSATVHNMLVDQKVVDGEKVRSWSPKKKEDDQLAGNEDAKKPAEIADKAETKSDATKEQSKEKPVEDQTEKSK